MKMLIDHKPKQKKVNHFPKAMKGECRAKPVKTEPTFCKCYTLLFYNQTLSFLQIAVDIALTCYNSLNKNIVPKIDLMKIIN